MQAAYRPESRSWENGHPDLLLRPSELLALTFRRPEPDGVVRTG